MHVIGIFGYIGCGKDSAAKILEEKYGYKHYSYGDLLREFSLGVGRTTDRSDLQKTRREFDAKHGKEYFPNVIVSRIVKDRCEKSIISGIRNPEDAIVPKKYFGKQMLLVFIDADKKKRYERIKKRRRDTDPTSFRVFSREESRECKIFDFRSTKKICDIVIKNNSSLKSLERQIDNLMSDLQQNE